MLPARTHRARHLRLYPYKLFTCLFSAASAPPVFTVHCDPVPLQTASPVNASRSQPVHICPPALKLYRFGRLPETAPGSPPTIYMEFPGIEIVPSSRALEKPDPPDRNPRRGRRSLHRLGCLLAPSHTGTDTNGCCFCPSLPSFHLPSRKGTGTREPPMLKL